MLAVTLAFRKTGHGSLLSRLRHTMVWFRRRHQLTEPHKIIGHNAYNNVSCFLSSAIHRVHGQEVTDEWLKEG